MRTHRDFIDCCISNTCSVQMGFTLPLPVQWRVHNVRRTVDVPTPMKLPYHVAALRWDAAEIFYTYNKNSPSYTSRGDQRGIFCCLTISWPPQSEKNWSFFAAGMMMFDLIVLATWPATFEAQEHSRVHAHPNTTIAGNLPLRMRDLSTNHMITVLRLGYTTFTLLIIVYQ